MKRTAATVASGSELVIEQLIVLVTQLTAIDFFSAQTPAVGAQQQEPSALETGN